MDSKQLYRENLAFAGTTGITCNHDKCTFQAGFIDRTSGRIELARFASGKVASMHLIAGLPSEWAEERDADGDICRVKKTIEAGFIRDGVFFSRQEVANLEDGEC